MRTGFRSLNFAVNVRNFSGEIQYAEQNVELPLNFRMGLSMDLIDFAPQYEDTHSFLMSVDATHPRAYEEQVKVGGEYVFMNTLSLRAGYTYPTDEESVNLGAGLRLPIGDASFGFDYSYTDFGIFDTVHRRRDVMIGRTLRQTVFPWKTVCRHFGLGRTLRSNERSGGRTIGP